MLWIFRAQPDSNRWHKRTPSHNFLWHQFYDRPLQSGSRYCPLCRHSWWERRKDTRHPPKEIEHHKCFFSKIAAAVSSGSSCLTLRICLNMIILLSFYFIKKASAPYLQRPNDMVRMLKLHIFLPGGSYNIYFCNPSIQNIDCQCLFNCARIKLI